MLQWMGGSRRKLRASAKSLKARQHQFFELRRQEQRERGNVAHGAAAAGNAAQEAQRHRSLDILGLEELRCGEPSPHETRTVAGAEQALGSGQATTSLQKQERTAPSPQAIAKTTTESKHAQQENDKPESAHVTRRRSTSLREGVTSHQSDSRTKKTPDKPTNSAKKTARGLSCQTGFKILDIINERGSEVSTRKPPTESYATFTLEDDGKEKRHAPQTTAGSKLSLSQRSRRKEREVTRKEFPVLATGTAPSESFGGTSTQKGYRSSRPKQSSENLEISKEFQPDFWDRDQWSPTLSDRRTSLPLEYVDAADKSIRPRSLDHESDLWTLPDFKFSSEDDTYLEAKESPLPSVAKYSQSQDSVLLTGGHPKDSNYYENQFSTWSPARLQDTEDTRFDEDDNYFGSPERDWRLSREDPLGSICPDTADFEYDPSRSFSTSSRQVTDLEPPDPPTSSFDFGLDKIAQEEKAIRKGCSSHFQSQRISMEDTLPPGDWFDKILPPTRSSSPPFHDNGDGSFFGDYRAQTSLDVCSGKFELETSFVEDTSSVGGWVMKPQSSTSSGAHLSGTGDSRVSRSETDYLRHSSENLFTNDTEAEISFERSLNSTRTGDERYRPTSSTKTSGFFQDKTADILESSLCLSPRGFSPVRESTVDTVRTNCFSPSTHKMHVSDNTADIFESSSLCLSPGGSGTEREPTLDTLRTMQTYLSPTTQNMRASDNLLSACDEFPGTNEYNFEGVPSIRTEGGLSSSRDTRPVEFSMFVQNFEAETGRPNAETLIVYFPPVKGEREKSFCTSGAPNFTQQNRHAFVSHTKDEENFAVSSKDASSLQRSASKETPRYDKGKEKILPGASWAETGDELFANHSAGEDKEIGVVELSAEKREVNALGRELQQFELEFLQSTSMTCATNTILSYPEPYSPKPWDTPRRECRAKSQRPSPTSTDDFGYPVARIGSQMRRDPSNNDEPFTSWRDGCDISGPSYHLSDQLEENAERSETRERTKEYQWEVDKTPSTSHDSKKRGGTGRDWAAPLQSRGQRESPGSNEERQRRKRNKNENFCERESRSSSEKQRQLFHDDDQADDKVQRHETSVGYSRNKTSREAAQQKLLIAGENECSHRQDAQRRTERTSSVRREIELKNEDSRVVLSQRRASLKDSNLASGGDVADHRSPETNRNSAHTNALGEENRSCPSSQERQDIQTRYQRSSSLSGKRGKRQSSVIKRDTKAFGPSSKEREDPADDQTQLLECESSNNTDGDATTILDRHDGGSKQRSSFSNKMREDKSHFPAKETLQQETTPLTTSRRYHGSKRSSSTELPRSQPKVTAAKSSEQQPNDLEKDETFGVKAALHQSPQTEQQQELDGQEMEYRDLPQQTGHTTGPPLRLLKPSSTRTLLGSQQPVHRSSHAPEGETTEILTTEGTASLSQGKKLPELCVPSATSTSPLQSTPEPVAVSRGDGRDGTPYVTMLETFIEQLRFENRLLQDIMEKQN